MTNCQTCGKLMASGTGELLCRACRAEANALANSHNAAPIPEPEPEVQVIIEAPPCVRCRKHDAMEDSHFCLGCQLELVNSLGDAAEELFRTPPPPLPPVSSPVTLMRDVEEKRQRTATSHMNVVGGTRLR